MVSYKDFPEMSAKGWCLVFIAPDGYSPDNEVVTFHRPRKKPNAIVDFERLETITQDWGYCPVELVQSCIKKVTP